MEQGTGIVNSNSMLHREISSAGCRFGFAARVATLVLAAALGLAASVARAQPQTQDDLPGRVGRVAEVGGELFLAPQDKPDQWQSIGPNYPVASGDNLWVGNNGRAEVDLGAAQVRLAGDSSVHLSRLDDRQFALFVGQGRVQVRVRVLDPGEFARVDTPNAQVVLTRPGSYRVDVSDDRGHTRVMVREGEANVLTAGAVQQVLPGQTAEVDGMDPQFANVRNGIGGDDFDGWVASRERLYARSQYSSYVSPRMVGAADLDQYGTWSQQPDYGSVWYPNEVAPDWAPYRYGYWTDVGVWGPTWVDAAPWGYAPFHYGRWAFIGGRWGWCPGAYVARPLWAPAMVAWTGGPGWNLSVSVGSPVYGWVPLGWGEPFRPWWGRCSFGCWDRFNRPYAVNVAVIRPNSPPPTRFVNWNAPGGITAVAGPTLLMRRSVQANMVNVPRNAVATAPLLSGAPMVRLEPDRVPTRRPGEGAPPPASTFNPIAIRPAPSPGGLGAAAGGNTMNRTRPGEAPPSASGLARPSPTAVAPSGAQPGSSLRPPPTSVAPASPPPSGSLGRPSATQAVPPAAAAAPGAMTRTPLGAPQGVPPSQSPSAQGVPQGQPQTLQKELRPPTRPSPLPSPGSPVPPTNVQPQNAQPAPANSNPGGNRGLTRAPQGTPLPPSMTPAPSVAPATAPMVRPAPAPSAAPAPPVRNLPPAPAPQPAAQPNNAPPPAADTNLRRGDDRSNAQNPDRAAPR
jgi:hypothetical protein